MDPLRLLQRFYDPHGKAYRILVAHGLQVSAKALAVARQVPHLAPDPGFIHEAAMLHDIGIFLTRAPALGCRGGHPYVCHGYLGARILNAIGFPAHAAVCERHVGAGLTAEEIRRKELLLPRRDMLPQSTDELIVAYADKFFSKNGGPKTAKPAAAVLNELARHGPSAAARFQSWIDLLEPQGKGQGSPQSC